MLSFVELGVFVPQSCPGNEEAFGGPDNCTTIIGPHDCSFEENFRCLVPFNKWVLAINFICMASFFLHYGLVWRRENFCVYNVRRARAPRKHALQRGSSCSRHVSRLTETLLFFRVPIAQFKESLEAGRLDLRTVLNDYPTAAVRLHRLNVWLFNISIVTLVLQVVNVISSAWLCFKLYPNGYKTYTTFATNCLLISIVLYNCTQAAWVGMRHELAYSAIAFEPVSYNSINAKIARGQ